MPRSTLAERIADLFVAEGIDVLFSLPEVLLGRIHHALAERGVPLFAHHHEAAGGHTAEAYTFLTGKTTAVGAARGPGVLNYYPAVASAWTEGRPVLFIGPEKSIEARSVANAKSFQSVDAARVLEPITKFSAILEHPELVDAVFHEAFRAMREGTMGPAYVGLQTAMVMSTETFEYGPILTPEQYRPGTVTPTFSAEAMAKAAEAIGAAERPLILAGSGIYQAGARDQFREFAEWLGVPVVTTHGGQGVLPDTHPQVFKYGLEPAATLTREADLVLALGTSIGDKIEFGGSTPIPVREPMSHVWGSRDTQKWVHVDRDPNVLGRNRVIDYPVLSDLGTAMTQLRRRIGDDTVRPDLAPLKAKQIADHEALWAAAPETTPIHSGRAVVEIHAALADDAIVVGGGGLFGLWSMRYRHANISAHVKSQKQGNIGSGVPYALAGGLLAKQDGRTVYSIGGDGSFQFYLAEIETAVRYDLPIVFVIGYDQGWSDEVKLYEDQLGRTYEVDHSFVRLDQVAIAMGAHGEYVTQTADIQAAIKRATETRKPAVVQIIIDRQVNAYDLPDRAAVAGGRDWDHVLTMAALEAH